jgi:hypothetical protein
VGLVLGFCSFGALASVVQYTVSGKLALISGVDPFGIDGANVSYSAAVSSNGPYPDGWPEKSFELGILSASIQITVSSIDGTYTSFFANETVSPRVEIDGITDSAQIVDLGFDDLPGAGFFSPGPIEMGLTMSFFLLQAKNG